MATSSSSSLPFLLHPTTTTDQDSIKPELTTSTNRGRKPGSKDPTRKKQPQRGMGVAQLERLRLQERWKSITETKQLDSFNLQPGQFPVPDPVQSVPVQYGTVSYGTPVISGSGFLGFDHQGDLAVQGIENGCSSSSGLSSGQYFVNPYFPGAPDMKVRVGSGGGGFETSKELSSMPKAMQHYHHTTSDVCFKLPKKRFNGENIGNNNGRIEKFGEISPIKSSDFPGSNLEKKINLINSHHMGGFSASAARNAFYANANHSLNEGVKVVAIHRKGNPNGGNVFMEYEFFPAGKKSGKNSNSGTCFEEMEFPAAEASVAVVGGSSYRGEASYVSDHSGYDNASNAASSSVDLSLRLSF